MKRLKLLSLLAIPAVILPVVFTATSCSAYSALNTGYKVINVNSVNKYLNELKKPSPSLHDLLWGGKGFNNGNYVLFVTHSIVDKGVNFLLNSSVYTKGNNDNPQLNLDFNGGKTKTDSLLGTITDPYYESQLPNTSYQFVVLVEEDTMESYLGSVSQQEESLQPCSPFEKYTEQDEKVNSDHTKDTYIRNDSAAKAYRKLMDTIPKLFKGIDGSSAGSFLALQ
jgi:hypothetical protein